MVLTSSTMMQLGSAMPEFKLADPDGNVTASSQFAGLPVLVMFICNHCPYVKHCAPELARLGADYADKIGIVAIQSNDVSDYPDDSPEKMKLEIAEQGYSFPYVSDPTQEVAVAFTAACTPDFFLFNADHELSYRGRLDATRPTRIRSGVYDSTGNEPNGEDLRAAIEAVLSSKTPSEEQLPSMGCNIKWTTGKEPDFFSKSDK